MAGTTLAKHRASEQKGKSFKKIRQQSYALECTHKMLVKVTSTLLLIKFHVSGQWWIGLGEGCPILSWQRPLRSQAKPFGSKAPRAVPRGKPSHVDSL